MRSPDLKISVIIPLKKLNEYVRETLEYLARQTYRNFDVYVITDNAERIDVTGLDVKFLSSGPVPPNYKRMQAAQMSDAEIIALIDDDAYPVPDWLEAAVRHFADSHVVAVGGPGITPPSDSAWQQVSGAVYASPLVSAAYVYRYLPQEMRDVDDYPSCNLVARRAAFLSAVPQCLKYWPGEDTKLCMLITRGSQRIVYDPQVAVYHHRRRLFWGHFRQIWNYAVHRGFFAKRYPATSLRAQYFVPTAFVAGNLATALLPRAPRPLRNVAGGLALVYAALVTIEALRSGREHRANPAAVALGIYMTHLTYGVGFAFGITRSELDH